MLSNILDKISFWSLFLVIVLLPIFFLPFTQIPIGISKGFLLIIGLIVSIIFWIIARFLDGRIILSKSWLLVSGLAISVVFLISALFSSNPQVSIFGTIFDVGTFYFIFTAFLLMLFSSIIFKNKNDAKKVLWSVIFSSVILFLFQTAHLFFPELLSMGVLSEKTSNILGSWNTFGLFTGFFSVISLFVIEFFKISKKFKWFLVILIIFSILLSMAVNFSLIWQILGVFALIIFVYKISFLGNKKNENNENKKINFPIFSFFVVMISLLFFMSGQFIGNFLPSQFNLSNVEVRPSFNATMLVTGQIIKESPIVGIGPNRFGEAWAMYKPQVINSTQFWNTYFSSGSGLLFTFTTTTGIIGILVWLIFLILFLISGIKSLFYSIKNNINWEVVLFFVASLYLFVASLFYSVDGVMLLIAFAFTGIFIGLSHSDQEKEISFSFLDDPRKSFFSILLLVVLMIAAAAAGFKYIERLASISYFGKALSASTMPLTEDYIKKAISLYQNDLYLRTYSQVYLNKINSLISKENYSLTEADKADLQTSFDQAINGAQLATVYNNENYLNFNTLGYVYYTVGSLGVKDVYAKAIEAYQKASLLNPLNPEIKLAIGRTFFSDNKIKEARDSIKEALSLKPDYLEALIIISQLEKSVNNNSLAISYAETALSLIPENKDLIQYLNSLKNITVSDTNVDSKIEQ